MANKRGVWGTGEFAAGTKKGDTRDKIFNLQPEEAPFVTMLSKLRKEKAVDTTINWFEDDMIGNYTQINNGAGYADDATEIVVDDATIFQPYDVIKELTDGECMLITSIVDSTHTLTVTRGWGSTAATALVDNEYIYKLGSAMAEGYTAPDSLLTQKSKKYNYLQIFSKTVQFTETAEGVDTFGGPRRAYEIANKLIELKRDIASQLYFGEPKEDTSGSYIRRQTGGIEYFMGSDAASLDMSSAALTESAFEGFLKDLFTYGGSERVLFCGPLIASQISQFASGKQRVVPGATKYGVKVSTYISALGEVHVVKDRHFIGPHAGKGFALDMPQIIYRYLQGQDFTKRPNIQAAKDHYVMDEYCGTIALEFRLAKRHGKILGVV